MINSLVNRVVWFPVVCLMLLGYTQRASAQGDHKLMIEPDNFIIGADVSSMQQYMMGGGRGGFGGFRAQPTRTETSTEPDWSWIDQLREGGLNYIRLRTFIDPEVSNGHERAYSAQGFCDLEHTIQVAKEVKARGMYFLLNFHYSNTWADPGKQWKPVAWENLHGEGLEQKVYDYTRDAVQRLADAGAKPDMVQVGNEIINGMLWPDGRIERYGDYSIFVNLLKAGIRGVRDVDPNIKIMVHLALGGENHRSRNFLDRLIARGVKFDIIGQSYYSQWHGTMSDLRENLVDLANRYEQPIIVVEYGGFGSSVRDLHDLVRSLPNKKGIGTFIFGGESLARGGGGFGFGNRGGRGGQQADRLEVYRQIARDYSAGKDVSMGNIGVRTAPPVKSFAPITGAEVSTITELEAEDKTFEDNGTKKDPFQILADKGVNMARIGVTFAENSVPASLALARGAKDAGLKIMIVMHYSDDYTRLGQQKPPAQWQSRLNQDLESTLFQYTRGIIAQFVQQGTPPDFVQIGNEISDGLLLPKAVVDPEGDFGGLVRVGSAGAREVDPNTNVILSMASAGDIRKSLEFLRVATITDVKFDAIAMSYVPTRDGSIDNLRETLDAITKEHQLPIAVVIDDVKILSQVRSVVNGLPNGLGLGTFVSQPVEGGLLKMTGPAS
jgi:arabinogalactan endo-1,4-beta-galactosidase